jgi:hypothetical protein
MPAYLIHDNGGRPFRVVITGSKVGIFKKKDKYDESDAPETYSVHVATLTAKKVFVGKSSGKCEMCDHTPAQAKQFTGNSLLVQTSADSYTYIGYEIFSFTLDDQVVKYLSPVGPNDVPYPLIVGKNNVYFLLDKQYVPRAMWPPNQVWEDAYRPWIGTFDPKKGWQSDYKPAAKKLRVKMISKRMV